ncbi:Odorant receptor 46a, isoform A [Trachymyrmex zeteki]|uniref:Odorant receptor 46a, isoform A n=1 Tax=Mycetomoellerius zeteki TaxID=64791 RepID=A0A151X9H8_9HYME|nr:Odorant receptor 46a, isoform A [Trachymyrmex zeteki]
MSFLMISYVTGLGFIITPALRLLKGGERVLPLKTYIPYSVSNLLPYLATYLQQFLVVFYAIMLNVNFDCLVYGFTIQACAQIDLMCSRLTDSLKNIGDISSGRKPETNASIMECVKHHLLVSILVKKIRGLFIWTVMIFFFFSLLIVCTSIFLISKKKLLSFEFLSMFLYLSGMLLQLFYYCWYGNELELKSKDIATTVYSCDWTMATPRERRSLMLIMISSQKGIMFSYHGIFALSLNTFAWRKNENICIRFLRFCYRYAIFLLIYEFTIFDVIEMIRMRDHVQELTEGLFLGLTFLTLCVKYANFLLRESELSDLLDSLRVKMCQPRNSMEKLIIEQHSRRAKWSSILFMMISYMTGFGFMVTPALGLLKESERVLPLKSYIPYSVSNLLPYLATYLQQFLTLFYGIMLNVTFDCLVYGFTIQVCAQIELMCCRLTDSLKNSGRISSGENRETSASIVECVKHHLLVNILKKLLSFEFLSMFLYLSGILLQLFYYCWYGNELELKSKDIATAVYSCDWTMVTPRERRSLMLIMISSQKGIMFSYHGIFALSLNTFTWICRTSYSAYNLLQQASN